MKLHTEDTTVISSGKERSQMTMVSNAQAFRVLSDTIYEHKILAVVRELSSNANDSHTDAGVTRPFRYSLPNAITSTFAVEDFGLGLDDEGVRRVMFSYFQSTKDNDDSVTGCLGLGSKSPLAYTDAFTITARKDGMERVYTSYWGEGGVPELDRVFMRPTTEPNGVRIELPVQRRDHEEFINAASFMACMFDTTPEFVGAPANEFIMENLKGFAEKASTGEMFSVEGGTSGIPSLYRHNDVWVSMGNVVYPTDTQDITELLSRDVQRILRTQFGRNGKTLVIPVEMGAVDFSASREKLSLTPRTKDAIKEAIDVLVDDLIKVGTDVIRDDHSPIENAILVQRAILSHTKMMTNSDEFIAWMRQVHIPMGDGKTQSAWEIINQELPANHTRLLLRMGLNRMRASHSGAYSDGHLVVRSEMYALTKIRQAIDPENPDDGVRIVSVCRERLYPRNLLSVDQSRTAFSASNRDELINKKIPVFYASGAATAHRRIIRDHIITTSKIQPTKLHHLGAIAFLKAGITSKELETVQKILGHNLFEYHDITAIHAEQKEKRRLERLANGTKREVSHTESIKDDADKIRSPWFSLSTSSNGWHHHMPRVLVAVGNLQKSDVIDTGHISTFYINPYDIPADAGLAVSDFLERLAQSSTKDMAHDVRNLVKNAIEMSAVFGKLPMNLNGMLVVATRQSLKRLKNSQAIDITSLISIPEELVEAHKSMQCMPKEVTYEPDHRFVSGAAYSTVNKSGLVTLMTAKRDVIETMAPHLKGVRFVDEMREDSRDLRDSRFHNVFPHLEEDKEAPFKKDVRTFFSRNYPILVAALEANAYVSSYEISKHVEMVDNAEKQSDNDGNEKGGN